MKLKIFFIITSVFVMLHIPYHPETLCENEMDNISVEDVSGIRSDIDIARDDVPEWRVLEGYHTSNKELDKGLKILENIVNSGPFTFFSTIIDYIFYISISLFLLIIILRRR